MKLTVLPLWTALLLSIAPSCACTLPLRFSASGGIGLGYYAMSDLNDHIHILNQREHTTIPDLTEGVNFNVQGRVWLFNRFAASLGYAHYYGEVASKMATVSSTIKIPANVYFIGAVANVLYIQNLVDINAGLNYCMAQSTFDIPQLDIERVKEFKANDRGVEIFAEAVTNFIRPVEVGFQLGYRRLTVDDLVDKFGLRPEEYFDTFKGGMELDYSGFFFFITAGVRL